MRKIFPMKGRKTVKQIHVCKCKYIVDIVDIGFDKVGLKFDFIIIRTLINTI